MKLDRAPYSAGRETVRGPVFAGNMGFFILRVNLTVEI
jgi:hypothetical protein